MAATKTRKHEAQLHDFVSSCLRGGSGLASVRAYRARAALVAIVFVISMRIPGFTAQPASDSVPMYRYQVVRSYPHDPDAFTQGLQYLDGVFYEGTGLNGRSSIRKVKIETGEVLQRRAVPAEYFGEGITVWKSELLVLTWRSQSGLVCTDAR